MQIQVTANAAEILRHVQGFVPRMQKEIAGAMDLQNQLTISHSQQQYLSGPRPLRLGVRTNRLRSSLAAAPARTTPTEVISSIGTNVVYGGIHERGFSGRVTVRTHIRQLPIRAAQVAGTVDLATGRISRPRAARPRASSITVRQHFREVRMPARPYLGSAIADRAPQYSAAISSAIVTAWEGGAV